MGVFLMVTRGCVRFVSMSFPENMFRGAQDSYERLVGTGIASIHVLRKMVTDRGL